jgi:hypothetical protein
MNNPGHISESLETILWVKILKFFDADPGPGWKTFGSGSRDGKNSDPGSGSATLRISLTNFAVWQVLYVFVTRKLILNLMRKVLKVALKVFGLKGTFKFYVKSVF